MVRPDSIAPNEVQILMPLVSGLTAEIVFGADLGLEVSRTQNTSFMGEIEYPYFGGSAHLFRCLLHDQTSVDTQLPTFD
jgi:hypothetical protein